MNQELKKILNDVIRSNIGNKITDELAMGLSVKILTIFEKAIIEASQVPENLNKGAGNGD